MLFEIVRKSEEVITYINSCLNYIFLAGETYDFSYNVDIKVCAYLRGTIFKTCQIFIEHLCF